MPRQWTYLKNILFRPRPSIPTWKDYFIAKAIQDPFPILVAFIIICNVAYVLTPFFSKWWQRMLSFLSSEDLKDVSRSKKIRKNSSFVNRRHCLEEKNLYNGPVSYAIIDNDEFGFPQMLDWDEEISKWNAAALSPSSRCILDSQHWENVQRKNAVCKVGKQRWPMKQSTSELGLPLQEASLEGIFQNYTPGIVVRRNSSEMVYPSRSMGSLTNGRSYSNHTVLNDFTSCLKELIEYRETLSHKSSLVTLDKEVQCHNSQEEPQKTAQIKKKEGPTKFERRGTSFTSRPKSAFQTKDGKHSRSTQDLKQFSSSHSIPERPGPWKLLSKTNTSLTTKNKNGSVKGNRSLSNSRNRMFKSDLSTFEKMKQSPELSACKSNSAISRQNLKRLKSMGKVKNGPAENDRVKRSAKRTPKNTQSIPKDCKEIKKSNEDYPTEKLENESKEGVSQEDISPPVTKDQISQDENKETGNEVIILKLEANESINMVANILSNHSLRSIISRELGLHNISKSQDSIVPETKRNEEITHLKSDEMPNIQDASVPKQSSSAISIKSKNTLKSISNIEVNAMPNSSYLICEAECTPNKTEKRQMSGKSTKGCGRAKKNLKNSQKNITPARSTATSKSKNSNRHKNLGSMMQCTLKGKVELPKRLEGRLARVNEQNVYTHGQKAVHQKSISERVTNSFQLAKGKTNVKSPAGVNRLVSNKLSNKKKRNPLPQHSVIRAPSSLEMPLDDSDAREQTKMIRSLLGNVEVRMSNLHLNVSTMGSSEKKNEIESDKQVQPEETPILEKGSEGTSNKSNLEEDNENSSDCGDLLDLALVSQEKPTSSAVSKRSCPSSRSGKSSLNQMIGVCHQRNKLKLKTLDFEKTPVTRELGLLQSSKPRSLFTKEMPCSWKHTPGNKMSVKKALHPQLKEANHAPQHIGRGKKLVNSIKQLSQRSSNKSVNSRNSDLEKNRFKIIGSEILAVDPITMSDIESSKKFREKEVFTKMKTTSNTSASLQASNSRNCSQQFLSFCENKESSKNLLLVPNSSIEADSHPRINTSSEGDIESDNVYSIETQNEHSNDHVFSIESEKDSFTIVIQESSSESLEVRAPTNDGDIQLSLAPKNEVYGNKREMECRVQKEFPQVISVAPSVMGDAD